MIAKENTSGFIPELQIVEESIYEDAMAIVEPVSYTHLDVYKRQDIPSKTCCCPVEIL